MRKLLLSLVAIVFTTSLFAKDISVGYVLVGPSNDGGYWLIAFSERLLSADLYLPFINIKWGREDVLEQTIKNLSAMDLKHDFLHRKIDIDTIIDIEKRE